MGLVNLTELNLSNTRITGDTYSFYPFKKLKKLNLDSTKVRIFFVVRNFVCFPLNSMQ